MPVLYVVATPIGNLEDISLRAIRILKEVELIAAEDTRKTRRLLSRYSIKTPVTSYHEHNKLTKLDSILDHLQTADVALVSDAGMPGLSDPGYELIGQAYRKNIPVVPVPGASAVVTALVASGLPSDSFLYLGFLPHKASERQRVLRTRCSEKSTLVCFESPHRIRTSLQDCLNILGNRRIAVCREMTKLHEEVFRGDINQAIDHFDTPRGEFTLVIEGNSQKSEEDISNGIENELKKLKDTGLSAKNAISCVAGKTGLPRKELYRTWLKLC